MWRPPYGSDTATASNLTSAYDDSPASAPTHYTDRGVPSHLAPNTAIGPPSSLYPNMMDTTVRPGESTTAGTWLEDQTASFGSRTANSRSTPRGSPGDSSLPTNARVVRDPSFQQTHTTPASPRKRISDKDREGIKLWKLIDPAVKHHQIAGQYSSVHLLDQVLTSDSRI